MTRPTAPLIGRQPDDAVFLSPEGPITARRLLGAARRVAGDLGSAPFVVNACRDRSAFAAGLLAAILAGRTTLLTGDRSPAALRTLAETYGELVLLGDEPDPAAAVATVPAALEEAAANAPFEPPDVESDRLVALVFTSGSTGRPVGHEKRWGALVERSLAAEAAFGLGEPEPATIVGTVPPEHMYGFETTVLLPLHANVTCWSGSSFYPVDIRGALAAASAPRILVTTPLHLRALLRSGLDLPPMSAAISATAPLDRALAEEVEARWGAPMLEIFGATEVGSIASRRTTHAETWRLYPGVRLVQFDERRDPVVEAPFARPHPLNDVVDILGPGEFRLLGRQTDIVKLAGRRASLGGLTQILLGVPGVLDGAFVVPPNLELEPTARLVAVVTAPGLTGADVLAALRDRMESVFLPRRIVLVDALPRDAVGKFPREAQLALLSEGGARAGMVVAGSFAVPRAHPSLPGHFPGDPIVPGVLLLAETLARIGAEPAGEGAVATLDVVKFIAPVRPDEVVTVEAGRLAAGRVSFACSVEGRPVLEGRARLASATTAALENDRVSTAP